MMVIMSTRRAWRKLKWETVAPRAMVLFKEKTWNGPFRREFNLVRENSHLIWVTLDWLQELEVIYRLGKIWMHSTWPIRYFWWGDKMVGAYWCWGRRNTIACCRMVDGDRCTCRHKNIKARLALAYIFLMCVHQANTVQKKNIAICKQSHGELQVRRFCMELGELLSQPWGKISSRYMSWGPLMETLSPATFPVLNRL